MFAKVGIRPPNIHEWGSPTRYVKMELASRTRIKENLLGCSNCTAPKFIHYILSKCYIIPALIFNLLLPITCPMVRHYIQSSLYKFSLSAVKYTTDRGVRKIRREYCYDKMDHGLVRSPFDLNNN